MKSVITGLILGLLISLIIFVLMQKNAPLTCSINISNGEAILPTIPQFLVILAEARSGSTWLGSFFKENENVLHFFEPLDNRIFEKIVDVDSLSSEKLSEIHLEILKNECTCQFEDTTFPSMGVIPSWSKSLHRLQGYLDESGNVLPQYTKPKSTDLAAKLKQKYPPDLGVVENFCNKLQLRSAKVIRLADIASLLKLDHMGCANFKVLHLIRDPRPIIQSRMSTFGELKTGNGEKSNTFQEDDIRSAARTICSTYLRNARQGLASQFNGRYKIVRYEDVAGDPVEYAREIYKYVNLELTQPVIDYIIRSSSGSIVNGKYEVVRNTSEVVQHWKEVMDPIHVHFVEEECEEMLRTFGYEKFTQK